MEELAGLPDLREGLLPNVADDYWEEDAWCDIAVGLYGGVYSTGPAPAYELCQCCDDLVSAQVEVCWGDLLAPAQLQGYSPELWGGAGYLELSLLVLLV
ncbi:hypothetical protein D3C81_2017650 [compost metagenome]